VQFSPKSVPAASHDETPTDDHDDQKKSTSCSADFRVFVRAFPRREGSPQGLRLGLGVGATHAPAGADKALVVVKRRVSVFGTSGSGKSALARRISQRLGVHVGLDAIHHQAGWMAMPEQQFRTAVAEQIARDAWVVGGNYRGKVGDLVWRRADVVASSTCPDSW
jgi:hypothetical protein